jgi:16S rRNA (adenine1518-N6/adenine1519-N6)-dimethyltransferase
LRKALGQHHLTRPEVCAPLVEFLAPRGREVLEVGPGSGVLTGQLLAAGARRVEAWELDVAWALALPALARDPRLRVVAGDALEIPWRRLRAGTLVAGNLPYNVATAIIDRALDAHPVIPRAGFLVQLEVARRLVAQPGDPDYGASSVLVRARAEAKILGRVKPGAFKPPPKVESAFVGFLLRPPGVEPAAMPALRATVRAAFSLRRKTLRNSLASSWGMPAAEAALARLGWSGRTRAEALALEDFIALAAAAPTLAPAAIEPPVFP